MRMASPRQKIKSGYLLRYKKRLLSKDWRKEYIVLLSDSSVVWFKDEPGVGGKREPQGRLVLKDAPQLVAYGQFTQNVPLKPSKLPEGYNEDQLLVFGEVQPSKRGIVVTVHWFLASTAKDAMDWICAIVTTLPPPPPPPYLEKDEKFKHEIKDTINEESFGTKSPRSKCNCGRTPCDLNADMLNNKSPSKRILKHQQTQEAAMNIVLADGTVNHWGKGSGWAVASDPVQVLCYYAMSEVCASAFDGAIDFDLAGAASHVDVFDACDSGAAGADFDFDCAIGDFGII